ncbi:MAG TPA: adenine phosphoribosyltransferase [Steroidobacteraceae bacterium]|nr:adenine phosphoribosyltransferase [Steroidobacteraceae bacterium]
MIDFRRHVSETPDFPQPGILFRDFSPLLRHHLGETLAGLETLLGEAEWRDIEVIAGVDARGFMLGAALAARRGMGFVAVRKAGKLPPPVQRLSYRLEYGEATLEIHRGSGRVLLVDDILATGGTLGAAARLCRAAGYDLRAILVLADLGLRQGPIEGLPVRRLLQY